MNNDSAWLKAPPGDQHSASCSQCSAIRHEGNTAVNDHAKKKTSKQQIRIRFRFRFRGHQKTKAISLLMITKSLSDKVTVA